MLVHVALLLAGVAAPLACASGPLGGLRFTSWDGLQTCRPLSYQLPETEEDVAALVTRAYERGERVKVVGAGHSFSGIALGDGHVVSLDRLAAVLHVDRTQKDAPLVTVQAGIRLHVLNVELERLGLALENLGATAEQSIAGATATGTHGTGLALGSLSTHIVWFRMVTGTGKVLEAAPETNPDLFNAGRVGLGALGIITAVQLRCVQLFRLRMELIPMALDTLQAQLPRLLAAHPRLQWWWDPDTANATLLLRTPTTANITGCWDRPLDPLPGGGTWCVDVSYKALSDSRAAYARRTVYTEIEMFVPVDRAPTAMAAFRALQAQLQPRHNPAVALFTGVRYVAADDIWLSPQAGRANAVLSMIVHGTASSPASPAEFDMYARGLHDLCATNHSGRPHWGKANYADRQLLARLYPKLPAFAALRSQLDPKGVFDNDYLASRLGPIDPELI